MGTKRRDKNWFDKVKLCQVRLEQGTLDDNPVSDDLAIMRT